MTLSPENAQALYEMVTGLRNVLFILSGCAVVTMLALAVLATRPSSKRKPRD